MIRLRRKLTWRQRWELCRAAAPGKTIAARWMLEYAALRLWGLLIGVFPIELNLRSAALLGDVWWLIMKRHRERALENLRPALGDTHSEDQLRAIARGSFRHFAQLYLVELLMTPRKINEWSWSRYVELGDLGPALRELLRERGTIMLTPHFGNFELLGFVIARLGLPITALMRPLDNPLLNAYLEASREAGGVRLLHKKGAMQAAEQVVADGGALCFIADQDAGRKGAFADFFNRPASWYKSIGLLAMHHRVPIVVGQAVRIKPGFRYRMEVERIIRPEEWDAAANPVDWITRQFARAMESGIRRHPEQYLWMHRRWKTQPGAKRKKKHKQPADTPAPESTPST